VLRAVTVLVTGGAGFIGHHLVEALTARGESVVAWDLRHPTRPAAGVEYGLVDLVDRDRFLRAFQALAPRFVVHLAARTDLDGKTVADYPANVQGVENLVAAIAATPGVERVICTSSQLVCRIGYRPASDLDYTPSTAYGESKVRTEQIWRGADGSGVPWCFVRPTTIWGPGMNPHYLRFFRMIREGRYFHVGGGPTFKSYGYVGNTVHQYLQLLDAPEGRIQRRMFFLADYEPLGLEEWAEAFRAALGAPPIRTLPRSVARGAALVGDVVNRLGFRRFPFNSFRLNNVLTAYQVDLSATREVCGPLPYTMADGVRQTVEWLREVWRSDRAA
jgi:nucleoside-diphosphate-sugar epimerase